MKKLLVFALYIEAKPFITHLRLKSVQCSCGFQVFENNSYVLVISGVGKIPTACATTYVLTHYANIGFCINIGICGGVNYKVGEIVCVDHVHDFERERDFFPEVIENTLFKRASLETANTSSAQRNVSDNIDIVDMEGGGFFEAANNFLPIHKIQIVKVVSDIVVQEEKKQETCPITLDKKLVVEIIEKSIPDILSYIQICAQKIQKNSKKEIERNKFLLESFYEKWYFTASQKVYLQDIFTKICVQTGENWDVWKKHIDQNFDENLTKKEQGKKFIQSLEQFLETF